MVTHMTPAFYHVEQGACRAGTHVVHVRKALNFWKYVQASYAAMVEMASPFVWYAMQSVGELTQDHPREFCIGEEA